jgi:hypothetical protein
MDGEKMADSERFMGWQFDKESAFVNFDGFTLNNIEAYN